MVAPVATSPDNLSCEKETREGGGGVLQKWTSDHFSGGGGGGDRKESGDHLRAT